MQNLLRALAFACLSCALHQTASAQIALSTTTAATQNFDTIGATATAALPANFKVDKPATVRTVGAYAAALTATSLAGSTNLSTTASNGIYNFGVTSASTDRAIGFLSSGSATQSGNLYAFYSNNTGGSLTGLQISYNVEKYRHGSNPAGFGIQLYYSTDGSTWTSAGSVFRLPSPLTRITRALRQPPAPQSPSPIRSFPSPSPIPATFTSPGIIP